MHGVFWSSQGIFLFSGHESNCYEIKFDLTIMSQEVNIICWPDGLEASLSELLQPKTLKCLLSRWIQASDYLEKHMP